MSAHARTDGKLFYYYMFCLSDLKSEPLRSPGVHSPQCRTPWTALVECHRWLWWDFTDSTTCTAVWLMRSVGSGRVSLEVSEHPHCLLTMSIMLLSMHHAERLCLCRLTHHCPWSVLKAVVSSGNWTSLMKGELEVHLLVQRKQGEELALHSYGAYIEHHSGFVDNFITKILIVQLPTTSLKQCCSILTEAGCRRLVCCYHGNAGNIGQNNRLDLCLSSEVRCVCLLALSQK